MKKKKTYTVHVACAAGYLAGMLKLVYAKVKVALVYPIHGRGGRLAVFDSRCGFDSALGKLHRSNSSRQHDGRFLLLSIFLFCSCWIWNGNVKAPEWAHTTSPD